MITFTAGLFTGILLIIGVAFIAIADDNDNDLNEKND